jgi:hypothetical protein
MLGSAAQCLNDAADVLKTKLEPMATYNDDVKE